MPNTHKPAPAPSATATPPAPAPQAPAPQAPVAPAPRGRMKVVTLAKQQIEELTSQRTDSVSAVTKVDGGWLLIMNMLEMKRIPPSTDMLASLEVNLDADGVLIGYQRRHRFLRDQALSEGN